MRLRYTHIHTHTHTQTHIVNIHIKEIIIYKLKKYKPK